MRLVFGRRIADPAALADACDLLVGADGVNSIVREAYRAHFEPSVEALSNRYVWYGTPRRFDALSLTFVETETGPFVAYHYRYSPTRGTFIVECDAATWQAAGFATMTEDESRQACEAVFRATLGGEPLLTNRSQWLSFRAVNNRRWSHRNVVLVGDALRSPRSKRLAARAPSASSRSRPAAPSGTSASAPSWPSPPCRSPTTT